MKRISYLLALVLGLATFTGKEATAALKPLVFQPAVAGTGELLMARRGLRSRMRFNVRASRYRRGAFSRGDCPVTAADFSPVVPAISDLQKIPAYLNASTHPTFFIQVPELQGALGKLFVEIPTNSLTERQIYKVEFDLTGEAGILGVRVPDAVPPLQPGTTYRWRVSVECSPGNQGTDVVAFNGAEFEQVADVGGTVDDQLAHYVDVGIWQSTIEVLASDRLNTPGVAAEENWAALMEASGTPNLVAADVVAIVDGRVPAR